MEAQVTTSGGEWTDKIMQLMALMSEAIKPTAAHLVAKLGIADCLWPVGTQKTAQDIATELKVPVRSLYRVMRMAGQAGLLQEHGKDASFSLTDIGAMLSSNHPSGARNFALLINMPIPYQSLGHLDEAVAHNKPGVKFAFGEEDVYKLLYNDPVQKQTFMNAMSGSLSFSTAAALSFDYTGCKKVVDVGGCQGALISAVLKAKPELEGVNMDRPEVIAPLPPVESELSGRLTHVAGDFFKPLPKETHGADVILLKFIL